MSMTDRVFSDEELTAFLDGQASPQLTEQIAAAAEGDDILQDRIEQLEAPVAQLRAAFEPDRITAPKMPDHIGAASLRVWTRLAVPAAMAACFALGLFVAPKFQQGAGWVDQVASYQALYVTETLNGAAQDPAATQAALGQANTNLGFEFYQAPQIEGMTFKRAQILAVDGETLLQLAYLSDDGVPYALCVTRVANDQDGVSIGMSHALATASWVQDGLGFVLVSGQDTDQAGALARQVEQLL